MGVSDTLGISHTLGVSDTMGISHTLGVSDGTLGAYRRRRSNGDPGIAVARGRYQRITFGAAAARAVYPYPALPSSDPYLWISLQH
jgi:hypothetical protein